MSRFMFPGKRAMRPMNNGGNTLAYFDFVDTATGLEYRDWRLIDSKKGVFVASPYRAYNSNGETRYSDFVRPAKDGDGRNEDGVAFFEELAEAAYAEYQAVVEQQQESRQQRRGRTRTRSARGPVKPPMVEENENDDLPF